MLSNAKQAKLLERLKRYSRKYLNVKYSLPDERGTRTIVNAFLSDVLGYEPFGEIKTEYMIGDSYADYVVQLGGKRYFVVEVKAMSLALEKGQLRPAVHFGANEGIEWVLLTNGRVFSFYKIFFNKTIETRELFTFDLTIRAELKRSITYLQCLTKEGVKQKGIETLWDKHCALDPTKVAGILYGPPVISYIKKRLREGYKHKYLDEEIWGAIDSIITTEMVLERVRPLKTAKHRVLKVSLPTRSVDPKVVVDVPDPMLTPLPVNSN